MPLWCHDGRDFLKGVWKPLLAPTCYFNLKSFSLCLQEGAVHFQHGCVALKQIQRVLLETSQATGWREGCRLENQTENMTVEALCCGFCCDLSGSGWQFGALYHNPSQTKHPLCFSVHYYSQNVHVTKYCSEATWLSLRMDVYFLCVKNFWWIRWSHLALECVI